MPETNKGIPPEVTDSLSENRGVNKPNGKVRKTIGAVAAAASVLLGGCAQGENGSGSADHIEDGKGEITEQVTDPDTLARLQRSDVYDTGVVGGKEAAVEIGPDGSREEGPESQVDSIKEMMDHPRFIEYIKQTRNNRYADVNEFIVVGVDEDIIQEYAISGKASLREYLRKKGVDSLTGLIMIMPPDQIYVYCHDPSDQAFLTNTQSTLFFPEEIEDWNNFLKENNGGE